MESHLPSFLVYARLRCPWLASSGIRLKLVKSYGLSNHDYFICWAGEESWAPGWFRNVDIGAILSPTFCNLLGRQLQGHKLHLVRQPCGRNQKSLWQEVEQNLSWAELQILALSTIFASDVGSST